MAFSNRQCERPNLELLFFEEKKTLMTYFLLEVFFINSRFEFFRLYLGQKIGSEFIPYVYGILLIALFPTMQDQIIKKFNKV